MKRSIKKILSLTAILFVAVVFSISTVSAETHTYNITFSADYSGPYAYLMKSADPAQKIFLKWWNEEVGKKLGIEIVVKSYDTRYNPAVVASLWPGILSGDKPILHLGLGGPDVASLMKRLPSDKVPLVMSTGTYGFCWLPNQWMFQPRPTYAHEFRGFLSWVLDNWKEKRPVRIGAFSTQGIPAYEDQIKGVTSFCSDDPRFEFVGVEWIKLVPVSVTSEMKRLAKKNPDYIYFGTNVSQVVATIRAQKELGIHIPCVMATHTDLMITAKALKGWKDLEGHYDVGACNSPLDKDTESYRIFDRLRPQVAPEAPWDLNAVQFAGQLVLALRAVERTAKKVGAGNITGEAIYNAMYEGPFSEEELLSLWPTLEFKKDAPFSSVNMKVKSSTVKNGTHVLTATGWLPIPELKKWKQ